MVWLISIQSFIGLLLATWIYKFALFHILLSSWRVERRQHSGPVKESLSANTKWPETVKLLFNLSTTYFKLHVVHGEGKLPKFHHNWHLKFWKLFPATLCWPEGENFPFLLLLMMKVRSDTKQNLHDAIKYKVFVFFHPANVKK